MVFDNEFYFYKVTSPYVYCGLTIDVPHRLSCLSTRSIAGGSILGVVEPLGFRT